MKKAAKALIVTVLGWQVRRLSSKHNFKLVAVVGGIGKTSTKFAIAQTLGDKLRVCFQSGNYNDIVSVPLIFFGHEMPSLLSPFAWLKIFINNEKLISTNYPYDVVIVELGTDGPGQIEKFRKYIKADIAVITAVVPEHMMFFRDMNQVAEEELSVKKFSKKVLINADLVPEEYISKYLEKPVTYGIHKPTEYHAQNIVFTKTGCKLEVVKAGHTLLQTNLSSFSDVQLYSVLAAVSVGDLLQLPKESIVKGLLGIKPVSGRMNLLNGKNNSMIIDDTYNSSPDAVKAALDTIYRMDAPHKVVLLGNMNELGLISGTSHEEIGKYCDPAQLEMVVTLGPDANNYLAAAAEKNGCVVKRANSPQEAGNIIAEQVQEGTLVLAKGSQNGVFAEEAVKLLLANPADADKLVRQSKYWLSIKQKQFKTEEM